MLSLLGGWLEWWQLLLIVVLIAVIFFYKWYKSKNM